MASCKNDFLCTLHDVICEKKTRGKDVVGIGHFTVVGLVFQPLSEREAEGDLVLIQTSFLF